MTITITSKYTCSILKAHVENVVLKTEWMAETTTVLFPNVRGLAQLIAIIIVRIHHLVCFSSMDFFGKESDADEEGAEDQVGITIAGQDYYIGASFVS